MKILIVDDSKTSLITTATYLEKLGHTVISTQIPHEAAPLFKSESPDLVILDVVMDEMSGYECAKQIRAIEQITGWVPIIFVSAKINDKDIAAGIEAGGDDYICKPFSELTLTSKIKAMERIATMRSELQRLSSTDSLTGMANRFEFEKMLEMTITQANHHKFSFALMFIDLDNFKTVNDTLGHHAGDLLLQTVSEKMQNELNADDCIARLGGDEFAIILNDIVNIHQAGKIANRIVQTIRSITHIDDNEIYIGCSIGIACYPFAGNNSSTLTKHADIAMYRAKQFGKNNYQYFTDELNKEHHNRVEMENALHKAITNNELEICYQPKLDLISHNIVGIEALIRWTHQGESIGPDFFIPLAEEIGTIIPIGQWVIANASKTFSQWIAQGVTGVKLALNISPLQLLKGNIVAYIHNVLNTYKIPAELIELEITETAIMTYSDETAKVINQLHDMGISLDIDDFGTGYSSLSHIKRLPIDALKIDKSFVSDIPKDKNDEAIVKSVISMSQNLGLNVIAEGIETEEQLKFLIQNGCTEGQGYYFSHPLSKDETLHYIQTHKG